MEVEQTVGCLGVEGGLALTRPRLIEDHRLVRWRLAGRAKARVRSPRGGRA